MVLLVKRSGCKGCTRRDDVNLVGSWSYDDDLAQDVLNGDFGYDWLNGSENNVYISHAYDIKN